MNDLTITQEYLLCSLNEKGSLPLLGTEIPICLLAGGIIELFQSQCVAFNEKKKIIITNDLNPNLLHLKSLYELIKNKKPMDVKKIAGEYAMSFSEKNIKNLVSDISESLSQKNCVNVESGGLFGNKTCHIPCTNEVDKIIQKVRAELLEEGNVSDETIALVSLLDNSLLLKKYFSKYETAQLKSRLKEIKESPSNQLVKQMVEYIDSIMIAIVAGSSASS